MVNWKFGDEFDEWEGQKGMPDFLAVRGDHSVVPTEVTNWYSIKVRLELKETYDHQISVLSEWKGKNHLFNHSRPPAMLGEHGFVSSVTS